jgi:hypothetical protein
MSAETQPPSATTTDHPRLLRVKKINEEALAALPEVKRAMLITVITSDAFQDCLTWREQVSLLYVYIKQRCVLTMRDIAGVFACNPGSVYNQLKAVDNHGPSIYGRTGRPPLLTEEAYEMTKKLVFESFEKRDPITISFLVTQISYFFNIQVSANTMWHIVHRMPDVKVVIGTPMEAKRIMVDPAEIDAYFEELSVILRDIPRELVINMDEAGCCEYVDSRIERVIVPASYEGETIRIPVDRAGDRATLVGAIAAGGERLKPIIIVPRKTIEKELRLWGYDADQVTFVFQENGFINIPIFELWVRSVLIPYVMWQRQKLNYWGTALLLLDGCKCHKLQGVEAELQAHRILVKPLVPHASDQIQPLDLGIYGLFKRYYMRSLSVQVKAAQTAQAIKMCNAWIEAAVPHIIVGAFRRAGMAPEITAAGRVYLRVDKSLATQVRDWRAAPFVEAGMGPQGEKRESLT